MYDQEKDQYFEIVDDETIEEVTGADAAGVISKHYFGDQSEIPETDRQQLEDAIENGDDNIKEYKVVTTDERPADNILVYNHVDKQYYKVGEGPADAKTVIAVQIDGKYYSYDGKDQNGDPKYTEITDEYNEAESVAQTFYANSGPTGDLDTIKQAYEAAKEDGTVLTHYHQYQIVTGAEQPDLSDNQYFTNTETTLYHPDETNLPTDTKIVTVFEDASGNLLKYEKDRFEPLSAAEKAQYMEAKQSTSESFPNGLVKTDTLKDNQESFGNSQAIEEAVQNGQDIITVDGKQYRINGVHSKETLDELGENVAYYLDVKPFVENESVVPEGNLTEVESPATAGVKTTITDYWISSESEDKDKSKLMQSGINAGHTLKFSTGTGDGEEWNDYNRHVIFTGIVQSQLGSDGYPVLKVGGTTEANGTSPESLRYLFDGSSDLGDETTKGSRKNYVSGKEMPLFLSDGKGNYTFDSSLHYTQLQEDQNGNYRLVVYNIPNKPNQDSTGQFFPFDEKEMFFDSQGQPINYKTSSTSEVTPNHYFGVKMELEYIQPEMACWLRNRIQPTKRRQKNR